MDEPIEACRTAFESEKSRLGDTQNIASIVKTRSAAVAVTNFSVTQAGRTTNAGESQKTPAGTVESDVPLIVF